MDLWFGGGGGSGGGGVRVSGDFHVKLRDRDMFGHGRMLCHFWLHTAMLGRPPPDMGGVVADDADAAAAAAAAVSATGVGAPGACGVRPVRVTRLAKHEVDVAAKDKSCATFDASFQVASPRPPEASCGRDSARICRATGWAQTHLLSA